MGNEQSIVGAVQKIGLLGGTFDPIHNGHLKIADFVCHALQLDRVLFVPAVLSPHKHRHADGSRVTPFVDRLAMLELALQHQAGFEITLIEAERSLPSYTIDTFREIERRQAGRSAFYFIMGRDSFEDIGLWKEYERLLDYASIVVVNREDDGRQRQISETVNELFPDLVRESVHVWCHINRNRVIYTDMEPMSLSSSTVRMMVRQNQSIDQLVPAGVASYIADNTLYSDCRID